MSCHTVFTVATAFSILPGTHQDFSFSTCFWIFFFSVAAILVGLKCHLLWLCLQSLVPSAVNILSRAVETAQQVWALVAKARDQILIPGAYTAEGENCSCRFTDIYSCGLACMTTHTHIHTYSYIHTYTHSKYINVKICKSSFKTFAPFLIELFGFVVIDWWEFTSESGSLLLLTYLNSRYFHPLPGLSCMLWITVFEVPMISILA